MTRRWPGCPGNGFGGSKKQTNPHGMAEKEKAGWDEAGLDWFAIRLARTPAILPVKCHPCAFGEFRELAPN